MPSRFRCGAVLSNGFENLATPGVEPSPDHHPWIHRLPEEVPTHQMFVPEYWQQPPQAWRQPRGMEEVLKWQA